MTTTRQMWPPFYICPANGRSEKLFISGKIVREKIWNFLLNCCCLYVKTVMTSEIWIIVMSSQCSHHRAGTGRANHRSGLANLYTPVKSQHCSSTDTGGQTGALQWSHIKILLTSALLCHKDTSQCMQNTPIHQHVQPMRTHCLDDLDQWEWRRPEIRK